MFVYITYQFKEYKLIHLNNRIGGQQYTTNVKIIFQVFQPVLIFLKLRISL